MKEYVHENGASVFVCTLKEYQAELKKGGYDGPMEPPLMPRAFITLDDDEIFDYGDEVYIYEGALDDFDSFKLVAHEICHALGLDHPDHNENPVAAFLHAMRNGFNLTSSTGLLRWRNKPKRAANLAKAVMKMLEQHES